MAQKVEKWTKTILRAGNGQKPPIGATVQMHYVGTFLDGREFDSSRRKGRPFSFQLGQGQVIQGWDEGVAEMSVGELATLVCPPEYAYGSRGAGGVIPGNTTIKFECELLSFSP